MKRWEDSNCLKNLQNLTLSSKRWVPQKDFRMLVSLSVYYVFFFLMSQFDSPCIFVSAKFMVGSVHDYTSSSPGLWSWSFQLWPSDLSSSSYSMLSPPVPDTPLADPAKWSGPCGEPDWEMFFFETSPTWTWGTHDPFAGAAEVDGILRTWSLYFCRGTRTFKDDPLKKTEKERLLC